MEEKTKYLRSERSIDYLMLITFLDKVELTFLRIELSFLGFTPLFSLLLSL